MLGKKLSVPCTPGKHLGLSHLSSPTLTSLNVLLAKLDGNSWDGDGALCDAGWPQSHYDAEFLYLHPGPALPKCYQ